MPIGAGLMPGLPVHIAATPTQFCLLRGGFVQAGGGFRLCMAEALVKRRPFLRRSLEFLQLCVACGP